MTAYYRFFPGDYLRDTLHLGWLEDIAYRRLIDLYMSRGRPIANDRNYIMRAIRASEPEQQAAVDNVLSEFFTLQADGWHQKKCDAEITHQNERSTAAKHSAESRWNKNKDLANADAMHSQCEGNANQNQNQNHIKDDVPTVHRPQASAAPGLMDPAASVPDCPHKQIIDAYHEILPTLRRVEAWTPQRARMLTSRWRECYADKQFATVPEGIEAFRALFRYISRSAFLMGKSNPRDGRAPFQCDLEWIVRPQNFVKILERKYHAQTNRV